MRILKITITCFFIIKYAGSKKTTSFIGVLFFNLILFLDFIKILTIVEVQKIFLQAYHKTKYRNIYIMTTT